MAVLKSFLVGILAVAVCSAQSIRISGQVTDTGGTPLPGAIVTLGNAGLTVTTGNDGSFALTSTRVRGQNKQLPTHGPSAEIFHGELHVNLQEKSDVAITAFSLQGKEISTLKRTMGAGTNSLVLPMMETGVYLYKVKFGGSEYMIKSLLIDGMARGTATAVQGSSYNVLAKQAKSIAAFNDAILITKDGYLSYRVLITNADTSGIEIKMTVGIGLTLVGLHRMIVLKNIPAGTFTMGSDSSVDYGAQPPHQVTLSAFAMQETDVTQEQYLAVMGNNPANFQTGDSALQRPVEQVSWYDAVKYCNILSLLCGLTAVYDTSAWTTDFSKTGYRLPTEAQWEYACRAGSITEYWWGADTNDMGTRTWSTYNSGYTTQPVATKPANGYGLYDVTGNVFQWCNDWYGNYTVGAATDPTGAATGTYRVMRGGSGFNNVDYFRSAYRVNEGPVGLFSILGFREVLPR